MNLLTKLAEKFKNIIQERKKQIGAVTMATIMSFTGLGMAGCESCNPDPNNTTPPIVTPGGENIGGTQTPGDNTSGGNTSGGTQTPGGNTSGGNTSGGNTSGGNTSGGNTSGGNTSGGNNNGGTQTPDYSKHSQILQNVLTDPYYSSLIAMDKYHYDTTRTNLHLKNPKYNAIPYGFLENEGYDIDYIKSNKVNSISDMFLDGNSLYLAIRIETKATQNYYTNYVLKYNLTNQEIKEMNVLFSQLTLKGKTTYIQAPFFIQEMSYLKTPEVVNKSYITVDGIKVIETAANNQKWLTNDNAVALLNASINEYNNSTHTYIIYESLLNENFTPSKGSMKVGKITYRTIGNVIERIDNKNVVNLTKPAAVLLTDANKADFQASIKTVDFYTCQGATLKNILLYEHDANRLYDTVNK